MGFKNMKRDDHGHVISNDETDGQECQHASGGGNKSQNNSERENLRKEVEYKLKKEGNTSDVRLMAERRGFKIEDGKVVEDLKSQAMADRATGGSGEAFDDTWDEEFNEYDNEMKKAQEENARKSLDLQDAINLADDDILDEEFGEDTPERKLVGALKNQPNEDKDAAVRKDVQEMRDEFYSVDKDEMDLINKEQSQRNVKEKQVQHFVDKAKELKKQGKMSDIWNMLRGLDDDTANRVLEELMGK